jgi:hypothetical protein
MTGPCLRFLGEGASSKRLASHHFFYFTLANAGPMRDFGKRHNFLSFATAEEPFQALLSLK